MFKFIGILFVNLPQITTNSTEKPNPKVMSPLFDITDPPIYGTKDPLFNEFLLPGIMVTGIFLSATALTGLAIIEERGKGLLERSLVAGATMLEILVATICVHFLVSIIQIVICVVTAYIVFQFQNDGSYLLIVILLLFQSITGMSLGIPSF